MVQEIESKINYIFSDRALLELAFVHRSYFNENREEVLGHNERLEFLGDAVLGVIVSDYLYQNLPESSEGHLSHLRAHLVGASSCAGYMHSLDLEAYLLLGRGEQDNVGRGRQSILADLFEALIGAIYLDGGIDAARGFILRFFSDVMNEVMETPLRNWKAELQDYVQKKYQKPPEYVVVGESGPPHKRMFVIAAMIEEAEAGRGEGSSKKEAEQMAAEDALRRIEKEKNGEDKEGLELQ